jgi:hypothetical protein
MTYAPLKIKKRGALVERKKEGGGERSEGEWDTKSARPGRFRASYRDGEQRRRPVARRHFKVALARINNAGRTLLSHVFDD